ncbi:MAG: TonB family protein [Candidatus Sulfotelmatobacter sp.]
MRIDKYNAPEQDQRPESGSPQATLAGIQPRRLLIALALLLVVLTVVVVNTRDFWFGSDETADSDSTSSEDSSNANSAAPLTSKTSQTRPAQTAKSTRAAKPPTKPAESKVTHEGIATPQSPVVATNRVVLPPLDVEVIAGDTRRTSHSGNNLAIQQIPSDSNRAAALNTSAATMSTNAGERERISSLGAPELRQTLDSNYPLLGEHARVQGSVVLEAIIGADGVIEGLRVISGPSILSTAAQQAVRQWHFKPYLENGQPVETKARITVNFTIRISDNSPAIS